MPWAVAGAVAAAGIGAAASNKAAKGQKGAADAATALQEGIYNDTRERNDPFYYAGTDALSQLRQRLGELTASYDPSKLTEEPGYQFGLQQGQQSLERSLASKGLGVSGAALKAAAQFGTDYGTTKLNDAFSRQQSANQQIYNQLAGLAGMGQASANQTAAAGAQFGAQAGSNMIGAANAGAASTLAQGNLWSNAVNQGLSTYGRRQTTTPAGSGYGGSSMYGGAGNTGGGSMGNAGAGDYTNEALLTGWADGGAVDLPPVRREPKIGTKGPRAKGGTGGGMSREAVLAALEAGDPSVAPGAGRLAGAGVLTVDPTNPRAVNAKRERDAGIGYADGGAVHSSTSGRADDVLIPVSGGEHVFDAELVSMLGDGNSDAGHQVLEELKQAIRAKKRATPAARPALGMAGGR